MIYKTVKIPEWAYDNALIAKGDVLSAGAALLPEELLHPQACPRCGSPLEFLRVDYERLACTACNYKQERLQAEVSGAGLGLGILIGLGLAALFRSESGKRSTAGTKILRRGQNAARKAGAQGRSDDDIERSITDSRARRPPSRPRRAASTK